jgi:TolB protein
MAAEMRAIATLLVLALVACGTEPTPPPPPFAGKIVFASDRGNLSGNPVLYSMNEDGSDITLLPVPLPPSFGLPDVSPDGRRVMFTRDGVYIVDANGLNLDHVLTWQEGVNGRFDPAGRRMVYEGPGTDGSALWIMDLQAGTSTRVAATPGFTEVPGNWSPDGAWICFSRRPRDDSAPEQIWKIRADGSEPTQLTFDQDEYSVDPAFSAAGDWIAYSRAQSALRLVRPDASDDHEVLVADPVIGSIRGPAWSPGDSLIALSYGARIVTVHPDGAGLRILADSGLSFDPTWGPAPK